jgi:hypothetical protein
MNQDENMTLQTQTNNPKPDDMGSVLLQGHIKIFDPETQEVFVDNGA